MLTQQIFGPVYLIDSPYHGDTGVLGTYLVKSQEPMLIDPGPATQVPGVFDGLKELKINTLRFIGLTHIHLDHSGGAWRIAEAFPEADVYSHPRGIEHLIDPSKIVNDAKRFFGDKFDLYGDVKGVSAVRISESKDGDVIDLQGALLKIIWTPGHASHSQCFWEPDYRILIAGDSAGSYSKRSGNIFPVSPPPFNPEKAIESADKLIQLKPEILCYSHFGFTYDAEKKLIFYREQLVQWSTATQKGLEEGLDLQGIWLMLKDDDPILRLANEENAERMRRAAIPNLLGFVEFYKWKRREEIKNPESNPSKGVPPTSI
jgi:glyoxylase-like metal-dependent hydrolase (beta-lactamase superfamily II)